MNLRLPWKSSWQVGFKPLRQAVTLGLCTALVAGLASLIMPNYYRSEARLLPVDGRGTSGLGALATAMMATGLPLPGLEGGDELYAEIVNSRYVYEELLKMDFSYDLKYSLLGPARHFEGPLGSHLPGQRNLDRDLREVARMITANRDAKSKILVISAETRSPELSQMLVKRAQDLLEAFLKTRAQTRGGAKASYAGARLAEARVDEDRSASTLQHFLETNRYYQTSPDPAIRLAGMRLEAEFKLRQGVVANLVVAHEQALMEEKNDMPILNLLNPAGLPTEKSRPARTTLVVLGFLVGLSGSLAWTYRGWLRKQLAEGGR